MIELIYTERFLRSYKALEVGLREDVKEKLASFCDPANHTRLKLHKLHGELRAYHAFSVNYTTRVVVHFTTNKAVVMVVDVGDHGVYD